MFKDFAPLWILRVMWLVYTVEQCRRGGRPRSMSDRRGGMLRCKAVVVFSFQGNKSVRIERISASSTPISLEVHVRVYSLLSDLVELAKKPFGYTGRSRVTGVLVNSIAVGFLQRGDKKPSRATASSHLTNTPACTPTGNPRRWGAHTEELPDPFPMFLRAPLP